MKHTSWFRKQDREHLFLSSFEKENITIILVTSASGMSTRIALLPQVDTSSLVIYEAAETVIIFISQPWAGVIVCHHYPQSPWREGGGWGEQETGRFHLTKTFVLDTVLEHTRMHACTHLSGSFQIFKIFWICFPVNIHQVKFLTIPDAQRGRRLKDTSVTAFKGRAVMLWAF